MSSLQNGKVASYLKTLLYDNLEFSNIKNILHYLYGQAVNPSGVVSIIWNHMSENEMITTDSTMLEYQQLVSKELQNCQQDLIECRQSTAQLNSIGLFCKGDILQGSKIGPYIGQDYSICEKGADKGDYWEIYDVDENGQPDKLSGFLVGSPSYENWMQFVRYARNRKEQNLEVVQVSGKIYFRAVRDIKSNEELLVWFGDFYELKLGIPSLYSVEDGEVKLEVGSECETPTLSVCNGSLPVLKGRPQSLLHGLFMPSEDGPKQKVWKCIRCTKTFISSGSLRAHARIHTGEKPYTCTFCQRSFCQMSTLRSHIRLHTGEKPFKCDVCHRSFTQSAGLRSHKKTHKSSQVDGVYLYSTVPTPK